VGIRWSPSNLERSTSNLTRVQFSTEQDGVLVMFHHGCFSTTESHWLGHVTCTIEPFGLCFHDLCSLFIMMPPET
jgi:hypothetical protein